MSVKLSYIIPVYNGEKYIRQCLDSIFLLPLSSEELEVIVVDDCSTDGTALVLTEYQCKHSNVVILHQDKNHRQGAARNWGIEVAKGTYIAFADADDVVVADGIMKAVEALEQSDAELCYFDFEYEQPCGQWIRFAMPQETQNVILNSREYLEHYYTCWYNAPWRNVFRTSFLRRIGVKFEEDVRWEDCDWTVKVYLRATKIQFIDGVGYRYGFNENATSKLKNPPAMAERVYAGCRLLQLSDDSKESFPFLSETLSSEAKRHYVVNELRLRNMTKYSWKSIREFYHQPCSHHLPMLKKYRWSSWIGMVINHECLTLFVLLFTCPLAGIGRFIVGKIR